jgi:cytochrome c556
MLSMFTHCTRFLERRDARRARPDLGDRHELGAAHEGAKGVVKERMDLMKGQAKQMKHIGDMAKGKKKFDATKAAARDLGMTTKKIPDLFPKRSNARSAGPWHDRQA